MKLKTINMPRTKGAKNKADSFVWTSITLGLPQETHDWYKSLASKGSGAKAKMIREAFALYRELNPE
ncbi:MAG: hypothetical protein ACK5X3_07815 [Pseudomonadota bacterium]